MTIKGQEYAMGARRLSHWTTREVPSNIIFKKHFGTSLVAQWLRTRLPMQGTWVRALVREDPTCRGATKPVRHNYWACALGPVSHNYWAHVPQLLKPGRLEPMLCNKRSPCSLQLEKAPAQQRRPNERSQKLIKKKNAFWTLNSNNQAYFFFYHN